MSFPRCLRLALLCASTLGMSVALAAPPLAAPTLSIEEAAALASARAQDAENSHGAIEAAVQQSVAAGQLPDPILKVGLNDVPVSGSDSGSLSRDSMTTRSISLLQEFTRADKRRARTARFEAEADSADARRIVGVTNVQRSAVAAWIDRWYAERARALLGHHAHPLNLALEAANAAYRSGRGTRADVLSAQLEVQKLQDRESENQAVLDAATVNLSRWIGADATRPLGAPPALGVPDRVEQLVRARYDSVPEIAAAQRDVTLAESEVRLATEARKPDISVELMYSQRGSAYSNLASINVSFPLPWDRANRQDREVSARLAQATEARAKAEIVQRDTDAVVGARVAELRRNLERLKRYDDATLPLANAQAEAALTAYRTNTGSLLAVAEANHRAIDTALERLTLERRTTRLWAELTFLTPLPTAQTQPASKDFK
ncbi:TolC family protein [Cupriavidus plantarum]|uniref:TolC family protein n=1 Tax=Cupriavidus plantarum TaxID=942865 RepID=UPI000EB5833D|nr:TolC family protein [Cupriavidus plantarum]RLK31514.1 outer membrane protein TolC [Cupriavidus plantarum]